MTENDQSKEEMRCQLEELKHSQTRAEEQLQQSSASVEQEKQSLIEEIRVLKAENDTLRNSFAENDAERSVEVAELKISLDHLRSELENYKTSMKEMESRNETLQAEIGGVKEEKEQVFNKYQESLCSIMEKDGKFLSYDNKRKI